MGPLLAVPKRTSSKRKPPLGGGGSKFCLAQPPADTGRKKEETVQRRYIKSHRRTQGRRQHARSRLPTKFVGPFLVRGHRSRRITRVFHCRPRELAGVLARRPPDPRLAPPIFSDRTPVMRYLNLMTGTLFVPVSKSPAPVALLPMPFRSTPRQNASVC